MFKYKEHVEFFKANRFFTGLLCMNGYSEESLRMITAYDDLPLHQKQEI